MRDDRKSGALGEQRVKADPGARVVSGFATSRAVLRAPNMLQAGAGADQFSKDPLRAPVFFLDGEPHKKRRTAIAKFFTPKAISTRHRRVMEAKTDELLAGFRAAGTAQLEDLSYLLAVAVAAEIVGLTNSDQKAMAKRINATLIGTRLRAMHPVFRFFAQFATAAAALRFMARDVKPAIKARRAEPREDVISHLLEEGASEKQILIECMTYAVAGMVTTREFIVMAAWHFFDNDVLCKRFLDADEAEQVKILEEILRLEPVAAMIQRECTADTDLGTDTGKAGEVLAINIRKANVDPAAVGECPFELDPDRAEKVKMVGPYMSFGDGAHRCPGGQVAIAETRIFLDRLMRVPGIRLEREPDMSWDDGVMSYELRGATIACIRSEAA